MTESEAIQLRKNGAKLYNSVRVALFAAAAAVAHAYEPDNNHAADLAHEIAEHAWHASHLDDTFHSLSSLGYKSLIQDGWNPFTVSDPHELHHTTAGSDDSPWEVLN